MAVRRELGGGCLAGLVRFLVIWRSGGLKGWAAVDPVAGQLGQGLRACPGISQLCLRACPYDRYARNTGFTLTENLIDFLPIAGDPSSMSDDMTAAGRGPEHPPEVDWTAAMPVGHQNPYTPVGEIEQIGKFASGLNRAGWRRLTGRILVLVILLSIIVGIIAVIVH